MKKKLLVILADDAKYKVLHNDLSGLFPQPEIFRALSIAKALSIIEPGINIIIAHIQPDSEISAGLHALQNHFSDIPVIVISDTWEQDTALSAIKEGAQDFLVNGAYSAAQLDNAISFAIERKALSLKNKQVLREYKKQFENLPIPMWIIDSDTMEFLVVNNIAVDKYGYSKDEFSAMTVKDIHPPESMDAIVVKYRGKNTEFYDAGTWKHVKKNGEVFYAHVYAHSTVYDNIEARLCFAIDVTEQLIMERNNVALTTQIREQHDQLENLLYSIGYAIWSRRADTLEIIYAHPNKAFQRLFGYTADEMVADKEIFFNNVHPDDQQMVYQSLKDAVANGASEIVFRYAHPDGAIKTFKSQINLKIGTGSHPDTITGVTFDITKEKQLTETIRNTELNLLATINNTKDQVWSINTKLEIVFCNRAYQEMIYELAGIIPKPGDYVLGEWGSESFFNTRKRDYERALAGESFTVFIEEFYDGALLYEEVNSSPVFDDEGKIVGVVCVARDISEQKNQFVQIQRQNEKLRDIAWIQSHKVRGPVASILGLTYLFNEEVTEHHNNIEIVEKLKIAANDLDNIIREVVDKTNNLTY